MRHLAVVTGLAAEAAQIRAAARRLGASPPPIACATGPEPAAALCRRLIAEGAEAIVSFGVCGGLDPALRPGDLVLAEAACTAPDGPGAFSPVPPDPMPLDPDLRTHLATALARAGVAVHGGTVAGCTRPVATVFDKRTLAAATGAVIVDMESYGVARAAQAVGMPVAVLRAVLDPARQSVPRAALAAATPDGQIHLGAMIAALARRPWEVAAMIR
ncbi:MAG: hypothetical protein D6826_07385, partial [Alphaproteobacteria bacterium]